LGARVAGARFLDLFAGSGAYGLEALSRGAFGGVFVERNPKAVDCLRRNLSAVQKSIESGRALERAAARERQEGLSSESGGGILEAPQFALRASEGVTLLTDDAAKAPMVGSPPTLVFIDPPYDRIATTAGPLFLRLSALLATVADAVVVFEMPGECVLAPAGWREVKRLGKGSRQPSAVFFKQLAQ
jgi:16S rRNA (guanine966-N2)-methyltransferase